MKITHFKSPAAFRGWLAKHHATTRELWAGYYKKGSGKPMRSAGLWRKTK